MFGLVVFLYRVVPVEEKSATSDVQIETTTPSLLRGPLVTEETESQENETGEAVCVYKNFYWPFFFIACNVTVLNAKTQIRKAYTQQGTLTHSLNLYCHSDVNALLPSSLHDDLFEGHSCLELGIYGCFLTTISRNAFRYPLVRLTIQGGFYGQYDAICNQDKKARNELEPTTTDTMCTYDYLWFPSGIFSGLNLHRLELTGLRLNDSIWGELVGIEEKRGFRHLNLRNNNIGVIERGTLNRLFKLRYIDLHNNKIQEILNGTFMSLNYLERLDLSQNRISFVDRDAFNGLIGLLLLTLTSNQIRTIPNGTFSSLRQLKYLDLAKNQITAVETDIFEGLERLETLDLRFNRIEIINRESFQALKNLKYLDLRNNPLSFKSLSVHIFIATAKVFTVKIWQNPWLCDCETLENMKRFMYQNATYVNYFSNLTCEYHDSSSNQSMRYKVSEVYMPNICQNDSGAIVYKVLHNNSNMGSDTVGKTKEIYRTKAVTAVIVILSVIVIGLIIFCVLFRYRKFLKILCFIKFGWKLHRYNKNDDANRPYDAFIAYNSKDVDIVSRDLVPRLEEPRNGRQGYKLCLHHRDFPVGACIAETIIDSVNKSKRVIMLLSNNFLKSEWCQYEFQKAHYQLLKERKNRIIMILLEEINPELLDKEMGLYLKTRTYVTYDDPWLWPKVEYAMPETRPINEINLNENAADDGIEFIQLEQTQ